MAKTPFRHNPTGVWTKVQKIYDQPRYQLSHEGAFGGKRTRLKLLSDQTSAENRKSYNHSTWSQWYYHWPYNSKTTVMVPVAGPSFPSKVMKRNQRWNNLQIWPRRDSNTGGSDLWSNAVPLDHGGVQRDPGRRTLVWERSQRGCVTVMATTWGIGSGTRDAFSVMSLIASAKNSRGTTEMCHSCDRQQAPDCQLILILCNQDY